MSKPTHCDRPEWSDAATIGMVGEGLTLRSEHVLGPTLYKREPAFGRGLASADRAPTWYTRSRAAVSGARSGLFSLLLILVGVFALTGCGGGGEDAAASDPATDPATAAPVTPPPADGALANSGGTSPPADATGGPSQLAETGSQIQTSEETPKAFKDAVGKKTILVFIYASTAELDQILAKEVNAAAANVKDIAFFSFQAGDYEAYQDIPALLNMYGSPSVSVVDRAGTLRNYWTGFVDSELLTRALQKANAATPASVTPGDVPSNDGGSTALNQAPASEGFQTGL